MAPVVYSEDDTSMVQKELFFEASVLHKIPPELLVQSSSSTSYLQSFPNGELIYTVSFFFTFSFQCLLNMDVSRSYFLHKEVKVIDPAVFILSYYIPLVVTRIVHFFLALIQDNVFEQNILYIDVCSFLINIWI